MLISDQIYFGGHTRHDIESVLHDLHFFPCSGDYKMQILQCNMTAVGNKTL